MLANKKYNLKSEKSLTLLNCKMNVDINLTKKYHIM